MTATGVSALLVALASAGLAVGVRLAAKPLVRIVAPPRVEAAAALPLPALEAHPDSLAALLVARDPFRVTRHAATTAYDPLGRSQPAGAPTPKPALALAGIVWDGGREPTALVEGFPGVDAARAVHRGEMVAGLRVKAIMADRVIIAGFDTTWTLTVREWK